MLCCICKYKIKGAFLNRTRLWRFRTDFPVMILAFEQIMNTSKAKDSTAKTKSRPKRRAAGKPADLGAIRKKIASVVADEALDMVNNAIAEVHKGQHTSMKYLFELVGLYPASAEEEGPVDDSLIATLLRRLGFPEQTAEEGAAPAGDVRTSDEKAAAEGTIE